MGDTKDMAKLKVIYSGSGDSDENMDGSPTDWEQLVTNFLSGVSFANTAIPEVLGHYAGAANLNVASISPVAYFFNRFCSYPSQFLVEVDKHTFIYQR
jgi:hypothetical protein